MDDRRFLLPGAEGVASHLELVLELGGIEFAGQDEQPVAPRDVFDPVGSDQLPHQGDVAR